MGGCIWRHGAHNIRLVNTNWKGGAFQIVMQKFKRAIRLAILSGNVKYKLGCLYYVKCMVVEAAHTCKASHSINRWRPTHNGRARWFSEHVLEGYSTFEQCRNGYDLYVHYMPRISPTVKSHDTNIQYSIFFTINNTPYNVCMWESSLLQ